MVDDEINITAMTHGIPEELKVAAYSNPVLFDAYDKVKDTLVNLLLYGWKLRTEAEASTADISGTPMEVDAHDGGKGKGKGGKDKGKHGKQNSHEKSGKANYDKGGKQSSNRGKYRTKGGKYGEKSGKPGEQDKGSKGKHDQKGKGPASDAECWHGGEEGHLAANCWHKPRQVAEVDDQQPEQRIAVLEFDDEQCMMALDQVQDDDVCAAWAEEQPREILMNAGSEVTFCQPSYVPAMGTKGPK